MHTQSVTVPAPQIGGQGDWDPAATTSMPSTEMYTYNTPYYIHIHGSYITASAPQLGGQGDWDSTTSMPSTEMYAYNVPYYIHIHGSYITAYAPQLGGQGDWDPAATTSMPSTEMYTYNIVILPLLHHSWGAKVIGTLLLRQCPTLERVVQLTYDAQSGWDPATTSVPDTGVCSAINV